MVNPRDTGVERRRRNICVFVRKSALTFLSIILPCVSYNPLICQPGRQVCDNGKLQSLHPTSFYRHRMHIFAVRLCKLF